MKKQVQLRVRGPVERVAKIEPSSVYLQGRPGDVLSQQVVITPSAKYPFAVLDVKKKNSTPIQVKLQAPEKGNAFWTLDIKAESEKADSLYEVLEVKTDSKLKPTFSIRVYVVFLDKQPDKKKVPEKS